MPDWLLSNNVVGLVLLVLACYNILGGAVVAVLTKIEQYLSPANPAGDNPKIEGIKGILIKTVAWAASIVDLLIGNKPH